MLIKLIEITTGIVLLWGIATQIVIPMWNNRPLFPVFNPKRKELNTKLTSLHELEDQQTIEQIVTTMEARIDELHK